MKLNTKVGGAVLAAGLLSLTMAGTAYADTNVGSDTTLAVVGSDTTQDVMEGLSNVVAIGGQPALSNYKAIPVGRTITTRTSSFSNPNCSFTAPAGSAAGRDALSAAMRGVQYTGQSGTQVMTGCVSVARSSSGGNPTTSPGVGTMTYIPLGTDSLTFATLQSSSIAHTQNLADLKTWYQANGTPGTSACFNKAPLIPSVASGTRQSWATFLGITDAALGSGTANSWGTCVRDTNSAGTSIQEHDGRFLTAPNQLLPFSTAQYIAQQGGVISDIRGRASLGSIDFDGAGGANAISPTLLQTNFGTNTRTVYNVLPTQAINSGFTPPAGSSSLTIPFDQNAVDAFVSSTSLVCKATLTIQQYGFAPISSCGDVSKRNTN